MLNVDGYILGNEMLHKRLCATAELLGELVMHAPRAVSIAQLARYTGRPEKELAKLCRNLCRAQLLAPDPITEGNWLLACDPSAVTLEDVFRSLVTRQPRDRQPTASYDPERSQRDVSLLVMQAAMGINQSVYTHLRRFSLDRLKVSAVAVAPANNQFFNNCRKREAAEAARSE